MPIDENSKLIETVIGIHRSETLALRHLRDLQRKNPEPFYTVILAARRNKQGRFSARGTVFYFEIWQNEVEEEEPEYGGAFDSP